MNLRKFYLIISVILAIFLSTAGIVIISNLNEAIADTADPDYEYNDELELDETDDETQQTETQVTTERPDLGDDEEDQISKTKPINILIVGGDKASMNTDTIMIINYDPATFEINILSIPRDTKILLDGIDRKINFAYPSGGNALIRSVILDLLGINIDRYIFLDVSAFRDIIDVLGGVEYNVPCDMVYDDDAQNLHIDLKAGLQVLNGDKAEQLVRFRKSNLDYEDLPEDYYYNGSDLRRINIQQDFIKELLKQKATVTNLPKVFKVMDIIFDRVKTDFTLDEILGYTYNIDQIDIEKIKTFVLSGTSEGPLWYFEYNDKVEYKNILYDAGSVFKKYFKSNIDE